jgi:hypothetical protein
MTENHYEWKVIGSSANSTEGRIRRRREKRKRRKERDQQSKDC